MNTDSKILLVAAFVFAGLASAIGGSSTINVTPGVGKTYDVITDGSGNFIGMQGVCDGTAGAQCLAVKAASTPAVGSDPSAVVQISPISPGIVALGQGTKSQSIPITIASDQNNAVSPTVSGDIIVTPGATFTRPANTTPYASGQLVANNTTAGSVVALSWATAARIATGNFRVTRVRMALSSKSITNTSFRVHLFQALSTVANGDGATFTPSTLANEFCELDVTIGLAGSDVSQGYGAPNQGVACDVSLPAGTTLYGFVEARAAYTPASGETITVTPEIHQN